MHISILMSAESLPSACRESSNSCFFTVKTGLLIRSSEGRRPPFQLRKNAVPWRLEIREPPWSDQAATTRRAKNGECIDILTELESWYARDNGQYLLSRTRQAVDAALETAFGYHLLQTGCTRGHALFTSSPINHRIYVAEQAGEQINLQALADELPLESDSIDTLIAHHTLDFADNPHQVLREIQRVLTPQGQLLIIGFNPNSLLGLNIRLRGLSRKSLWHRHAPVSERRLTDWLDLLGCKVQGSTHLGTLPLARHGAYQRWSMRLDDWSNRHHFSGGSLYVVRAIKQVSAVHRSRRQWQLRKKQLIGLVPKPAPSHTLSRQARDGTTQQKCRGERRV